MSETSNEEPVDFSVQYGDNHRGKGWFWWCTEYPEEGSDGPFDTEAEAVAMAESVCGKALKGGGDGNT